jgi:hypothetical protein
VAQSLAAAERHTVQLFALVGQPRSWLWRPWCDGAARSRKVETLEAGMYLVGCAYNFCWTHASLRQSAPAGHARK